MADPSPLRVARAAVFTAVCVGVTAAGHAATSGHDVPAAGLLAAAVPVFGLAYAGTARERRIGTVTAWLAWVQLALHMLFSLAQTSGVRSAYGASAQAPSAHASSGGHHGAALVDPVAGTGQPGLDGALSDGGAAMLLAHAAATLVAAWWIRRGEAAAFSLVRYARALFERALLPPAPGAPPVPHVRAVPVPDTAVRVLFPEPLLHSVRRRGPPVMPRPGHPRRCVFGL